MTNFKGAKSYCKALTLFAKPVSPKQKSLFVCGSDNSCYLIYPNKVLENLYFRYQLYCKSLYIVLIDVVYLHYQEVLDRAYDDFKRAESVGAISTPKGVNRRTYMGQLVDGASRCEMKNWTNEQGTNGFIYVNKRLYSPLFRNQFRVPDVRINACNGAFIFDATVGHKTLMSPQIHDFFLFGKGNKVTIVRPSNEGGSYSILQRPSHFS